MTNVKFTSGLLIKISSDYFTLVLSNNDAVVYKATVPASQADAIAAKHAPKIVFIEDELSPFERFQVETYGNLLPAKGPGLIGDTRTAGEILAGWMDQKAELQLLEDANR